MFGKTPIELYELSWNIRQTNQTSFNWPQCDPPSGLNYAAILFFFELKGFGEVRYEPPEELTRTYEYMLPDNADPTARLLFSMVALFR